MVWFHITNVKPKSRKSCGFNPKGSYFTLSSCSSACRTEAQILKIRCYFRNNANDKYPCKYTLDATTTPAKEHHTRHAGNCSLHPLANKVVVVQVQCVYSGGTYVCRCKSSYYQSGSSCFPCASCTGRKYISSSCTAYSNTVCKDCVKPTSASYSSYSGCAWTCNSEYYKSGSTCHACRAYCTGHTYESKSCTSTQNVCTTPRNRIMHHGIVVMCVVGHVMRDIINLAVHEMHVHHPVLVIHRKRVFVHRHKTVYVHLVRNLPIQSFPRLQDVVGIVNLAITKVAVIVLLALYVQQDNLNQKVAHQHKIVNVL